jgi:hypothetical protein
VLQAQPVDFEHTDALGMHASPHGLLVVPHTLQHVSTALTSGME